jgi:hypothetical protein
MMLYVQVDIELLQNDRIDKLNEVELYDDHHNISLFVVRHFLPDDIK